MVDGPLDELDRLAARSLAAREAESKRRPGRPVWPWVISAALLAFALGMIGSPWFEREARSHMPVELRSESLPAPDPRVDGLVERIERLESAAPPPALPATSQAQAPAVDALDDRVAAMESRAGTLAAAVEALAAEQARSSNALALEDSRLKDLFLLALARRMLEAGRPLTSLEPALEARYRQSEPAALDALLAWSRAPQSRHTLKLGLDALNGEVAAHKPAEKGWWDRLKERLGGLVTVRESGGSRPVDHQAQMAKAEDAMAAGDVTLAIAALQPLPQTQGIRQWTADARLLQAADAALSRLEGAAIDEAAARIAQDAPAPPQPQAAPQGQPAP